jgi:hypothetical protein
MIYVFCNPQVKDLIEEFKAFLPLFMEVGNPAMQKHHWSQVRRVPCTACVKPTGVILITPNTRAEKRHNPTSTLPTKHLQFVVAPRQPGLPAQLIHTGTFLAHLLSWLQLALHASHSKLELSIF